MIKQFVCLCVLSAALASDYDYLYDENVTTVTEPSTLSPYDRGCWRKTCPPGYYCPEKKYYEKCVIDEESCMKYYGVDEYKNTRWRPDCRKTDGAWEAKQCKDDRCFCYDEVGNRIFGQAFANQAENMTCACSRSRASREAERKDWYLYYNIELHCDAMGNFQPTQCDEHRCWCTDPKGEGFPPYTPYSVERELIANYTCLNDCCQMVRMPGWTANILLDCLRKCVSTNYKEVVGEYRTACEVELYSQEDVREEFSEPKALRRCLYDGSFGPVNLIGGYVHCLWRDRTTPLGYKPAVWEIPFSHETLNDTNCNCAVDAKIYADNGLPFLRTCMINGNYDPVQRDGDNYFCVDNDGYRINEIQKEKLTAGDCKKIII